MLVCACVCVVCLLLGIAILSPVLFCFFRVAWIVICVANGLLFLSIVQVDALGWF